MDNTRNAIDESYIKALLSCIGKPDKEKTKTTLRKFPKANSSTRARALYEISMTDNKELLFILDFLIKEANPPSDLRKDLIDLVLDKARANSEFILLFNEVADKSQLREATPVYANILVTETDTNILSETIKAVGKTGEKSCINVLTDFIFYDNSDLKHAAVTALGEIGGPSVIKRLAFASSTSKSDPYILSTLEKLKSKLTLSTELDDKVTQQFASRQDTLSILDRNLDFTEPIKMLNSESPHDRHKAIGIFLEEGAKAIPAVTENIDFSDPDSIINSLAILGNTLHEAALPAVYKILNINHSDSNVRFAAYEAISKLPLAKPTLGLIEGLTDSSEQVRLAAATAINTNLSEVLLAGIRSKVETSGKSSKKRVITASIIDSHSGNIFSRLLDSDSFISIATDYLSTVHESTLTYFVNILLKRGSKLLAKSIKEQFNQPGKGLIVYLVDNSEIALKYNSKIFHAMGHTPIAFNNPIDALEALKDKKPDLITTNLNMLNINGLQLTAKIRAIFNSKELPIVIITTQNDFVKAASPAGTSLPESSNVNSDALINLVLKKPLAGKEIKPLLDKIVEVQNL